MAASSSRPAEIGNQAAIADVPSRLVSISLLRGAASGDGRVAVRPEPRQQAFHGELRQIEQQALTKEEAGLGALVSGGWQYLLDPFRHQVDRDESHVVEGDTEALHAAALVRLCRGVVDLKEAHAGLPEPQGSAVVASADDEDCVTPSVTARSVSSSKNRVRAAIRLPPPMRSGQTSLICRLA